MDSGLNLGDNPDNSGYAWINFTQRLCYYKYAWSQFLGIALVSFSHGISGQLQRCWWPSPLGRHGRRRRCAVALESTCLAVFFYTLRAIHDSPFILVGLLVSNCDGVRVNRAIYWFLKDVVRLSQKIIIHEFTSNKTSTKSRKLLRGKNPLSPISLGKSKFCAS